MKSIRFLRPATLLLFGAVIAGQPVVSAGDDVLMRVAAHAERFEAVSRQIWESPELGYHETKSSLLLQQELTANGFTVKAELAGASTAFTAQWGSGRPVIALMG
jgi:aminobenzoyl-glutamate utilization protein B